MITINISQEEKETAREIADLLRYIADQIDLGYTSGFYPHWNLEGEEE